MCIRDRGVTMLDVDIDAFKEKAQALGELDRLDELLRAAAG